MDALEFSDSDTSSSDSYSVDYIVADRVEQGRIQYLLKWQNTPHDEDAWASRSRCECPELIGGYEERKQLTKSAIDEPGDLPDRPCQVLGVHRPKGSVTYTVVYASGERKTISSRQLRRENVLLAIDFLEQHRMISQKPK
jgi:hypothetical protein